MAKIIKQGVNKGIIALIIQPTALEVDNYILKKKNITRFYIRLLRSIIGLNKKTTIK